MADCIFQRWPHLPFHILALHYDFEKWVYIPSPWTYLDLWLHWSNTLWLLRLVLKGTASNTHKETLSYYGSSSISQRLPCYEEVQISLCGQTPWRNSWDYMKTHKCMASPHLLQFHLLCDWNHSPHQNHSAERFPHF